MEALRGAYRCFSQNISQSNAVNGPYQRLFCRGIFSKLFVKGLPFSMTDEALAKAFSKYGDVVKADVVRDKVRQKSKGFGYVTFAEDQAAENALKDMNGKLLDGRVIFVDAEPRRPAHKPVESPSAAQTADS